MKKGLFLGFGSVAVIAAIIVLGGPYVAGNVAERTTRTVFDQVQKQLKDAGVPATVSLVEYDHGWLHSKAITRATFVAPDDPKIHFCIDGTTIIDHSPPVLVREHWAELNTQIDPSGHGGECDLLKELKASPQFVSQFIKQFGNGSPVIAKSAVRLGGVTDTDIALKPFKYSDERGAIDLKPLSGHSTMNEPHTHMRFNMDWGGIQLHVANASGTPGPGSLGIGKMTLKGEKTLTEGTYWLGPSNMLFNDIDFQGNSSEGRYIHWHTKKITVDSNGSEAADGMHGTADVELLENSLNDSDLGDLSIVSSTSGLDLMEVATLQKRMNAVQQRVLASGKPMTEAELRAAFTELQRAIANADLKFKTIRYELKDSTATIQADIRLPGLANATFDDFKSEKTSLVNLAAIDASGKIEDSLVPKLAHATALAMLPGQSASPQQLQNATAMLTQRMEGTLQIWTQQGLLIREPNSGDYSFTANLADGQISVNGRPWVPTPKAPSPN